jgi:hypothetical protein
VASFRFIEIGGKHYLWRDILQLRREQKKTHSRAQQPCLFELKDDSRPLTERTAAGRYLEPSLFALSPRFSTLARSSGS